MAHGTRLAGVFPPSLGCRRCSFRPLAAECHRDTGVWNPSQAKVDIGASPLRPWNQRCVPRRPNIQMKRGRPPTRRLAPWGKKGCAYVEHHGLIIAGGGGDSQAPREGKRHVRLTYMCFEADTCCESQKFKPLLDSRYKWLRRKSSTVVPTNSWLW